MKKVLILLMLFISISCYSQKYTLLEINAKWNSKNNLQQDKIGGIRVQFGWLENQPKYIQEKIQSVPTLIMLKDGKFIYKWQAGLNLKLKITEESFKKVFDKLSNGEN